MRNRSKITASVFVLVTVFFITFFFSLWGEDYHFDNDKWIRESQSRDATLYHAPHYQDGLFFNPWLEMEIKNFLSVIEWKLASQNVYPEEERSLPVMQTGLADKILQNRGKNYYVWLGHGSILISLGGELYFVDPVFGDVMMVPSRLVECPLKTGDIKKLSGERITILLTHNHYDHMDADALEAFPDTAAVYVPKGLKESVKEFGFTNIHELDWWEDVPSGKNKLTFLPAQHWSKRNPFNTNASLWGSYLLTDGNKKIYIAGDSGYCGVFREIGKKYGDVDLAFLPIGASRPRWFMHYNHMDENDLLLAARDLGAKKSVPVHWGTFTMGDEPAGYSGQELKKKLVNSKPGEYPRILFVSPGALTFLE